MSQELSGTIKFFKEDKGFGFIELGNGQQDVFLHISKYQKSGMQGYPQKGDKVIFELGRDKGGKEYAVNLRPAKG